MHKLKISPNEVNFFRLHPKAIQHILGELIIYEFVFNLCPDCHKY